MSAITDTRLRKDEHRGIVEPPTICPICWDNRLEPVEGVHLSATVDGLERLVLGVSAYRCGNWHVFTVVPDVGLPRERKEP